MSVQNEQINFYAYIFENFILFKVSKLNYTKMQYKNMMGQLIFIEKKFVAHKVTFLISNKPVFLP
jgi:hypothetical protein